MRNQSFTRPRRAARAGIAFAAAISLAAAGCSSSDTASGTDDVAAESDGQGSATPGASEYFGPADAGTPTDGGIVVMGIEGEPEQLDPSRTAFSSSGHYVASAVYEPLVTLDENGDAVPYLLESIEPNEDATVWTLKVRDGITFHDGTPLDADAVLRNLKNRQEAFVTSLSLKPVTSMEAVDDSTVEITLDRSWHEFPTILTTQVGYMVQPDVLESSQAGPNPVGTGPFKFDEHVANERWTFTSYEDYWRTAPNGDQLPYLDGIEFRPIPDDANRITALDDGTVNLMHTVSPEQVLQLESTDEFKVVTYSAGEENFMVMNMEKAPFDSLTARQAVVYASDSQTWLDDISLGSGSIANSAFAPGQTGYLADNGYPAFDMAKAKELVAQYEAETGEDFAFTYLTVNEPRNIRNAQYFQSLYEEAGMTVEIEALPQISLVAKVATGDYQASAFRNYGQPNPDTDVVFWSPESVIPGGISLNFARITDPELQELLNQAWAETDETKRNEIYQEVSRIWGEQLPYMWMGRLNWALAANPVVNGIRAAENGSLQTLGPKTWLGDLWVTQ